MKNIAQTSLSPAVFTCWQCHQTTYLHAERFDQYFDGQTLKCEKCGEHLKFWQTLKAAVGENFLANSVFALIGASSTIFHLTLRPGMPTVFKYTEYGIPAEAKILYVNYTPNNGGLFPAIAHDNIPTRIRRTEEVALWPHPISTTLPEGITDLTVLVTWSNPGPQDIGLRSLFQAAEPYSNSEFHAMVIPANVAVEYELGRVVAEFLQPFVARTRLEQFLNDAATYSHQLNVLLPMITGLRSLIPLPAEVLGFLRILYKTRNQLAHEGSTKQNIGESDATELLAAAIYAVRYLRHISSKLTVPVRVS